MRKTFAYLGIAAMAMSINACQTEKLNQGIQGETDFSISTSLPSGIVTYAGSNQGGIFNVAPDEYDLRFTLEVYDGDALAYSDSYIVKDNFETASATFEMRLLAKEYDFVFFADFITEDDGISYYDLTDGLDNIRLTGREYGNNAVDSYYKKEVIDLSTSGSSKTVTLKRKFGKIRLLATDDVDNIGDTAPSSVKIEYNEAETPASFNARTGEITSATLTDKIFTYTVGEKEMVTVSGRLPFEAYLIGFDYIIPSDTQTSYSFNITVYDENNTQIGYREISSIPVKENMLTTVIGNFYSNEGSLEVIVDDEFDSETVIEGSEEVTVSTGSDLAKIIKDAEPGTTIYLEEGEYNCPDGIVIDKPIKIIGAPEHKSVISSASNSSATIRLKGNIAGSVIDGIQIYGGYKDNGDGVSDAIAVWGTGTEDSPVIIRNCIINRPEELDPNIAEYGYLGISTTYGDFEYLIIENNTISDANYGMYFNSISNSVIRNNSIENTRRGGIVIGADKEQNRCSNVQITGNALSEISWAGKNGVYDYALSVAGQYGENITESDNTVSYATTASESIKAVNAYGFDITGESLSDMVSSAADGATIRLEANTTYNGDVIVPAGKHIRIIGSEDNSTKITGQVTVSGADLYIENVTIEGTKYGLYSAGQSSIEASNCVFNITPNDGNTNTAVMTWAWNGNNDKVHLTNCVFNAEGVRTVQLRQVADAKIEGCTFNSPYTYAVQLDEAGTNLTFNNNTVNNAQSAIYVHSGTTASSVSMSGNTCNNVIYPYCGRPQALNDNSNTGMNDFWYYVTENADSNNNLDAASNKPGRTVALSGNFTNRIKLSYLNNGQKIYGPNWNIDPTSDEASLKTSWTISSEIKFSYDTGNKILENIEIRGLYIKGGYMNQQYGGLKNVTIENCAFIGNTTSTNGFIAHLGSHSATENYVLRNNLFRTEDGTVSSRVMLWGSNATDVTFEGNRLDKAYLHIDGAVNAKVSNNYIDVTGLDMIYNVILAGGSDSYVSEFTGNTYKGASFCVYYLHSGNFIYGQNIRTSGDSYYGIPNLIGLRGASIDDNLLTFEGYSSAVYRAE